MLIDREWYEKHKADYTKEEIAELGIEISVDGKCFPKIPATKEKGTVKTLMKAQQAR